MSFRYFNFPIILLDDFINNSDHCLNQIFDYCIYEASLDFEDDNEIDAINSACHKFNVSTRNPFNTLNNGRLLYDSISHNTPKTGISINVYFDYYDQLKTEWEKIQLLAHLALKSILRQKPYCKVTNNYFLARMDGKTHSVSDYSELGDHIRKYANEYQIKKIKNELILNWGLKHYSRYTRGFYVSYSIELEDLIYYAEKKRKSRLLKAQDKKTKESIKRAMKRLMSDS